ncbi:MAG: SCO family protein [Caldilineaceae bacterium]|nr:SCO family protein [Caldilineaceae bacterium]
MRKQSNLHVMHIALPQSERPREQAISTRTIVWYSVFALPFLAMLAFAFFKPILVMPRMGLGPGFALVDQQGARLTNEDLRGQIVLYNFTYTTCAAPCPQTSAIMQQVQTQLPAMVTQGIPVTLVTMSIDPTHDTPEQLRAYATQVGADLTNWHFATGEATPLKYVIGGGFGVYYQATTEPGAPAPFTLDPAFVLVDGAGIMRGKYRTATPDLAILQRDIELVAKEASQSTGVARLAYEAAHLFVCYPK